MNELELRGEVAKQLLLSSRPATVELAAQIEQSGCWGAVAEDVERICTETEDYVTLLDVLVQLADPRALLLFIGAARSRPAVFEAVARRADALPRVAQCALVSLPMFDDVPELSHDKLCPAARAILQSPPRREDARIQFEAHVGQLRSLQGSRS
jgi:hypothetical protein